VTLGGRLFISGGYGLEGKLKEAVWSGKDSMKLEGRRSMISARRSHCMTVTGECLLVTGGMKKGSTEKMQACELYDIEQDAWKSLAPMNEARYQHAAVEVKNGVIYVFCGLGTGDHHLNSIERYRKTTDSWEQILTNIKLSPRLGLGAVSINDGD